MSTLRNVPGNNVAAAPASTVVTPAKGTSIFGALSSVLRSAQGKRPVSDARETVKMVLRVFAEQDWAKLPEVQLASVKAYEASMSADEAEPLTHIYRSILEIFGSGLSSIILNDLAVVFPRTIEELDGLKDVFASNARSVKAIPGSLKSLLRSYTKKERSAQTIKDYEKIVALVAEAEAGIVAFYKSKAEQINAAKTFVKESAKANAAATRAAASAAAAATRKAARNAATAAAAATALSRKAQKVAPKSAASLYQVTNANIEAEMAKLVAEAAANNKGKAAWAALATARPSNTCVASCSLGSR